LIVTLPCKLLSFFFFSAFFPVFVSFDLLSRFPSPTPSGLAQVLLDTCYISQHVEYSHIDVRLVISEALALFTQANDSVRSCSPYLFSFFVLTGWWFSLFLSFRCFLF
jgi:hypothetical protein